MSLFQHVELNAKDPAAARKFYSGVFGFKYQDMPMPDGVYTMIQTADGQMVGGIQKKKGKMPVGWVGYITVPSVKRALAKATKRGAKVIADYTPVPGMGAYAAIKDPDGAAIGIWEAAAAPKKAKKKAAKNKTAKKKTAKKAGSKKAASNKG